MSIKLPSIVVPFKVWNGLKVYSNGIVKRLSTDRELQNSEHQKYCRLQYKDANGKYCIIMVHRLIALVWLPKTEEDIAKGRDCVDHIDGNRMNNDVSNLRWCTVAENNSFRNFHKRHLSARENARIALYREHKAFRKKWPDPDKEASFEELVQAVAAFHSKSFIEFFEFVFGSSAFYHMQWIKIVQDGALFKTSKLMFRFQLVLNPTTMKYEPKIFVNMNGVKTEVTPQYIIDNA